MEEVRVSLRQFFLDGEFIKCIQELLALGVEAAVTRAMEHRDAKLATLEEEMVVY